jgi:RNA polymerase sigma-70 factor, ECF subfamily
MSDRALRTEFEALIEPVLPAVFRAALHMTRNRDDAEDLVQEAAVQAFRAFHTFSPGTNFKAWLFRITTNAYYQSHRRRQRQPETTPLEEDIPLYLYARTAEAGLHSAGSDPAGLVLGKLDREQISAAIFRLPEEYRVVCALHFVEELSYQEIAEIVACPIGTVRSRLHRGRRLLQQALWHVVEEQGVLKALKGEAV